MVRQKSAPRKHEKAPRKHKQKVITDGKTEPTEVGVKVRKIHRFKPGVS